MHMRGAIGRMLNKRYIPILYNILAESILWLSFSHPRGVRPRLTNPPPHESLGKSRIFLPAMGRLAQNVAFCCKLLRPLRSSGDRGDGLYVGARYLIAMPMHTRDRCAPFQPLARRAVRTRWRQLPLDPPGWTGSGLYRVAEEKAPLDIKPSTYPERHPTWIDWS